LRRPGAVEEGRGEAQFEIRREVHVEAHAPRKGTAAIEILPAGDDVFHETVAAPVPVEHNATPDILAERDIDHSLHARFIIIGIAREQVAFIFAGRSLGDEIDRAAVRVTSIERALRAAQDLDPLEVDLEQVSHRRTRLIDTVDMNGDAGGALVEADAADRHRGLPEQIADLGAGNTELQPCGRRNAAIFEHLRIQCRDGDRNFLNRLRPLLRGDHDVARANRLIVGGFLRQRRDGKRHGGGT